jgi:flagellar motor protein MotB
MTRIISWLQNVFVRVFLTLALVVTSMLLSATFSNDSSLQAQAEPLTPEATQYEVNSQDSPFRENDQENARFKANKTPQSASETTNELGTKLNQSQNTAKQNIESAADTVREKLNLDQPLYPGTKEVLEDAKNAITGERD